MSNRCWIGLGVFIVLMNLAVPKEARAENDRMIRLVIGEQKQMSFPGTTTVSVGNPGIADVRTLSGGSFLLFATGAGRTTLMVMRRGRPNLNFTVVVSKEDVRSLMAEVRKLLGDREGITIRPVGDRVILDGRAFTSEDHNRVLEITKLYPQVKSFVKVNPNAKKLVANQLNVAFKAADLKNVEATVVGSQIFLEGSVESQEDLQKAEMITKAIGEVVENLLSVGIKRMVLVEVEFVEVRETDTDRIGIKWPFDLEGSANSTWSYNRVLVGPGGPTSSLAAGASANTSFHFGFLFQSGFGRVLAEPKLVCASGEKAEFHAGGEIPIVTVTAMAVNIEYKPFGVLLKITPIADRHGNIQMDIFSEVSEPDRSLGVTVGEIDIPGFQLTRAKTNVTVRHGQTIVLSGLFHEREEKDLSKVPLVGHIPIIGELFKSRTFQNKKSELTVYVTPRIVNPDTPKILKMISDIKARYTKAASEVGFGIFD